MTLAELVQLYAPFAGLALLSFWVGALGERVKNLRKDLDKVLVREAAETGEGGILERMIRAEIHLENALKQLESMDRHIQSINRQLGNLMKAGKE